jgi:PPP family 3-phenylpropionic acid transporter
VWLPYLPLYLLHLGFEGWQIGVVAAMQPALRWGGSIAWAYAADRWRVRRRLLVATAVGGTLCFVPFLFVRTFGATVAVLAAIALLHGPLIPFVDATVMDHLERLGGDYGRLRLWGSAAFVIGALLSAPLVRAFSPAVVPLLLLLPQAGLAPALARLPAEQLGHGGRFRPPWTLLTPPLTALLAVAFLLNASSGAWAGLFAVHTTRLGLSDTVPGVAWAVAVTAEMILLFWGGRVLVRIGPTNLIAAALIVTAARWTATALARGEVPVVLIQAGQAFTFGAFHVAALAHLARLVPAGSSTGGQTLYGLVGFGAGGSLGLALAGLLVDRLGSPGLFGFEAALAGLALLPALRLRRLVRRHGGSGRTTGR